MTDITITQGHAPADQQRPSFAKLMNVALAPYNALEEFAGCWSVIDRNRSLIQCDRDGDLVVLKRLEAKAYDEQQKADLCRVANKAFDEMPTTIRRVSEVYRDLQTGIQTKPAAKEKVWMIGKMLDALGIKAGDDTLGYAEALAFELADARPDRADLHYYGVPNWIPMPAIAHAFRKQWQESRETYGRPPLISDIMDRCRESRRKLLDVRDKVFEIKWAAVSFHRIALDADTYPWGDDEPPWDDGADMETVDMNAGPDDPF